MTKIENKADWYDRITWGAVVPVSLSVVISLYGIWVVTVNDPKMGSPKKAVLIQAVQYLVPTGLVIFVMQFDAEQLFKITPIAYGMGIILLIAVLFLYNKQVFQDTGAKSRFRLGSLTFQPFEVMKPAFILMLVGAVERHNGQYAHTFRTDCVLIGKILVRLIPVAVLPKLQNDFGTMLVSFVIVGGVILVSGISWKTIIPVYGLVFIIGAVVILLVITLGGQAFLESMFNFRAYQFQRTNSWLNPSQDTSSGVYQLRQSMKVIGSGQIWGHGFGKVSVYVLVRILDMVFSVIGESLGFAGCCASILIYFYLIFQMVKTTFKTRNVFYSYIPTGTIMMILFHVFESIGMGIDLLPLTGVPLPSVSQGGSALLGNMIGIGLILSTKWHRKDYISSTAGDF